MCGIAGIIGEAARDVPLLNRMGSLLRHRGPDDQGVWLDPEVGIGLVHRRLSIVDLSAAGHEPMHSANGRFVITYNGEIYNHAELRAELEKDGAVPEGGWRGHSDTEVFLEAICAWGLEAALAKSVGMFAFALWDREKRLLSLVRDRFGEKPLYYGWAGRDFLFGSELKALRAHPRFDESIDRDSLRLFASLTYIPAPRSIYRQVYKLPPGCILRVDLTGARVALDDAPREGEAGKGLSLTRYWSYKDVVRRGLAETIHDEAEALTLLEDALATSIHGQSVADVPVGAFLSGGIDSSTVIALYQRYSSIPVRTFSIGFEETGYDEARDAKRVAQHLGTVHQEHYVTAADAREVIPLLPSMYDEPFADSSQIPTYLVSRFARREVTVALTGDGGDELFAGYNRHFAAPKMWARLQRVPRPLRAASTPLSRVPPSLWNKAAALVPGRRQPHLGGKLQKALGIAASANSLDDIYCRFLDEWSAGAGPVAGAGSSGNLPFDLDVSADAPDAVRMMYCDAVSYLPDDILCKVDRASMAVSLETRVPFLDHRVAEAAARIPISMKIGGGTGKLILRKLLARYVPGQLVDRPKAGFQVPVGEWIKGPLRPWAEDLLDSGPMRAEGWFDAETIGSRWRDHCSGKRDSTAALWAILMFQAWLREKNIATAAAA
jgi:asparagine synthase (glutamine-hydrolysing)